MFIIKSRQKTDFRELNLISRDKVRDMYSIGHDLLIVTTDRISAFDVIMPDPVPGKGVILNHGNLILIDELLTPDSSRFRPADEYKEGRAQKSCNKQFLSDYLLSIHWNRKPSAPQLPSEIIDNTRKKYEEALKRPVG